MNEIDFRLERLILKIGNTINNIRHEDLENNNLTSAQSETILFYSYNSGKSIKDLALHLKISHQAARKLVDKLKSKNILETLMSTEDKRYSNVYLTEFGAELCGLLKQKGTLTGENMLKGFSESDKAQLYNFLEKIEVNIDEE